MLASKVRALSRTHHEAAVSTTAVTSTLRFPKRTGMKILASWSLPGHVSANVEAPMTKFDGSTVRETRRSSLVSPECDE